MHAGCWADINPIKSVEGRNNLHFIADIDVLNNCGLNSCGWCRGKVLVEVSRRSKICKKAEKEKEGAKMVGSVCLGYEE